MNWAVPLEVWTTQLFNYCERGHDPGFWAEPANAATNLAFLGVAVLMMRRLCAVQNSAAPWNKTGYAIRASLIALVAIISFGSFGFHTFATRLAKMGDVIPISLFMIAYLVFALRHFLQARAGAIMLVLTLFAAAGYLTGAAVDVAGNPYFNGSLGYLPALLTLLAVGIALARRGDPVSMRQSRWLIVGGCVFALSMVFRSIDFAACDMITVAGHKTGTHFLWHLANALTLYLLLRVAIDQYRDVVQK